MSFAHDLPMTPRVTASAVSAHSEKNLRELIAKRSYRTPRFASVRLLLLAYTTLGRSRAHGTEQSRYSKRVKASREQCRICFLCDTIRSPISLRPDLAMYAWRYRYARLCLPTPYACPKWKQPTNPILHSCAFPSQKYPVELIQTLRAETTFVFFLRLLQNQRQLLCSIDVAAGQDLVCWISSQCN